MKCPYCNKEMVKGYIQCRDGVDWTEKKQFVAALSALGKGRTSLANGAAENNSAVYAYKCEKCECNLLEEINVTQLTLSHHMKILCDAEIVVGHKEGKWMHYSISEKGAEQAKECLRQLTTLDIKGENKSCCEK